MKRLLGQVLWFLASLTFLVFGNAMVISAGLGAAPWDIFHIGVSQHLGIPLSLVVQAVGAVVILLNMTLAIRPSLGMVLNMLSVGPILQFWLTILPQPEAVAARWLMLGAGLLIAGLGSGLYVSAGIGTGPRDGMMIGLTRRLGRPVGLIKNGMEVVVALSGWLLGGPIGLGTLAVALCLGPSIQLGMAITERLARVPLFSTFVKPISLAREPAVGRT